MKAKLNPAGVFVRNLKKRIKQNNGYCPCKLLKTPDTKCQIGPVKVALVIPAEIGDKGFKHHVPVPAASHPGCPQGWWR